MLTSIYHRIESDKCFSHIKDLPVITIKIGNFLEEKARPRNRKDLDEHKK